MLNIQKSIIVVMLAEWGIQVMARERLEAGSFGGLRLSLPLMSKFNPGGLMGKSGKEFP
jgi:hypothetical protein